MIIADHLDLGPQRRHLAFPQLPLGYQGRGVFPDQLQVLAAVEPLRIDVAVPSDPVGARDEAVVYGEPVADNLGSGVRASRSNSGTSVSGMLPTLR